MNKLFIFCVATFFIFFIFVLPYIPVGERIYTGIIFNDGTQALINADSSLKYVGLEWQKLPSRFNSKQLNGLIVLQINWFFTASPRLDRYRVFNPCTTNVDWWGYGKIKINFTQIDSSFGCKIIDYPTDTLLLKHKLEEKPIWVWEPNPDGWKKGKLIFKD